MYKSEKNTVKKPRGKYEEKLKVKGSFLDIIKASVKDANAKTVSKRRKRLKGNWLKKT